MISNNQVTSVTKLIAFCQTSSIKSSTDQDGWFLQTTIGGKETSVVTSEEVATYQDTDEEEKHLWENCTFVSGKDVTSPLYTYGL